MKIAIVAPGSAVPQVELQVGVDRIRAAGFDVFTHPQCAEQHFTFAGRDESRAAALFECAQSEFDAIWCARGGYGCTRLLPLLDELTRRHGPPPRKLLIGYSDVTALHEFVRSRWNWATLHAVMPAVRDFKDLPEPEWSATVSLVGGRPATLPWATNPLHFIGPSPAQPVRAPLIGGNLCVWNCLTGTPWGPPEDRPFMLFLEDLAEAWYRVDRMIVQLEQSGRLDQCRGIVLGDFTKCEDESHTCWAAAPTPQQPEPPTRPLRRTYSRDEAMAEIFGTLGERLGIPVAAGLPVGHGPGFWPLPLAAEYELAAAGTLRLQSWSWLR